MSSASFEAAVRRLADGPGPPPVERWHPERVADMDLEILADGRWIHEGREILRPELVRLFSSILRRDTDGYCLVTPAEKQRIRVADAPFLAVEMQQAESGPARQIALRTNVDDVFSLDAQHPIWLGSDGLTPYTLVRRGLHARITRSLFYQLIALAEAQHDRLFLRSGDRWFLLGDAT